VVGVVHEGLVVSHVLLGAVEAIDRRLVVAALGVSDYTYVMAAGWVGSKVFP
jgi:hypothetical protein